MNAILKTRWGCTRVRKISVFSQVIVLPEFPKNKIYDYNIEATPTDFNETFRTRRFNVVKGYNDIVFYLEEIMKPKEYINKYHLDVTENFNHADFISDFTADFMTVIEFLQEKNQLSFSRFNVVVKEIRAKWDGISNKCKGTGLPDKLWSYFYATVVGKTKDNLFGELLRKKKEVHEQKQREWKERHEWENNFHDNFRAEFFHRIYENLFGSHSGFFAGFELSTPASSFGILGLESSASIDDVKSAYRKLSLTHHPDKGGDRSMFEKIMEAKNKCLMYLERRAT